MLLVSDKTMLLYVDLSDENGLTQIQHLRLEHTPYFYLPAVQTNKEGTS